MAVCGNVATANAAGSPVQVADPTGSEVDPLDQGDELFLDLLFGGAGR